MGWRSTNARIMQVLIFYMVPVTVSAHVSSVGPGDPGDMVSYGYLSLSIHMYPVHTHLYMHTYIYYHRVANLHTSMHIYIITSRHLSPECIHPVSDLPHILCLR